MSQTETPKEVEVILAKSDSTSKNQCKSWFFTFNNYEEKDIQILINKFSEPFCESYVFEKEVGKSGTPHLQGVIFLKEKMRWSEFKLSNKISWFKTKNNENAIKYCQKEHYENGSEIWSKGIKIKKRLKLIEPNRPYQKLILDILSKEPNDRTMYWFHEPDGGVGKSQFVKYLVSKFKAIFIDEGKKADIMNTVLSYYKLGNDMERFIFDVPRQNMNKISWKSIESIKNGLIYSPKYEGGVCVFNSPHIIIFSNFPPDVDEFTLSADRIKCYRINEDFTVNEEIL